jgi:hypothetical protein
MAALLTIKTYRGCAAPRVYRGRNPDGSPLNLAGCTATAHVYPAAAGRPTSGTPALARDTGNGKVVIQPGTWAVGAWDVLVAFSEADSLALAAGTFRHELVVVDALGQPDLKFFGPLVHALTGRGYA